MSDQYDEIRSELVRLPDDELRKIANAPSSEYRRVAIDFARSELSRRGVPWLDNERHHATGPSVTKRRVPRVLGQLTTNWPHLSRKTARTLTLPIAGLLLLLVVYQNPRFAQGKTGIYFVTAALDLFVLSYLDVFRRWKAQTPSDQIRAVGLTLIAGFFTVWSILCLVGVIKYES